MLNAFIQSVIMLECQLCWVSCMLRGVNKPFMLSVIMPNAFIQSVIILNAIMLSVAMLNVVAPVFIEFAWEQ